MKDQWLQRLSDKDLPSWMRGTTTGFRTRSGLLAFMSDYDAAYQSLYDLLPNCNGCFCL